MAKNGILKNLKKKVEELGKKIKGKECQKPSMSLESNVGMVKGNKKAHYYAKHLKFITGIKKQSLESRNSIVVNGMIF